MCDKLGEFFAFITMLGGIEVEELELFQMNEERLCAVLRKKKLGLLSCEVLQRKCLLKWSVIWACASCLHHEKHSSHWILRV